VRHFSPELPAWIGQIRDPRFPPRVVYDKHFLVWFGLMLLPCELGSRRQANFHLNGDGPEVLHNLNRLAGTAQQSCPADKPLEYFWRRAGSAPWPSCGTGRSTAWSA
jgi:hypothetical protein